MFVALPLTSLFCTNCPISSLRPLANASGAAEPCAIDGVSESVLNSAMNFCAIESKMLGDTSVRAGIEPFFGLNAAWPSWEPQTLIQLIALARSGAPLGSPNVSQTIMYVFSVPGDAMPVKSVSGFQVLAGKSPLAESPVI